MSVVLSANEISALVLKAARGGGLALGDAEDLAAASAYLHLDLLEKCPCVEGGGAIELPTALDFVRAGGGPQRVAAQAEVVAAYVAEIEAQTGQRIVCEKTSAGVVLRGVDPSADDPCARLGRRAVADALLAHLVEMGAKLLVPETAASREGGAGAGLTDND